MTLAPVFAAPPAVLLHLATVLPAAGIGGWLILASRKGALWHRRMGYLFLALMTVTALSTVFVREIDPEGGLSPIHLLIPVTLLSVAGGLIAARRHDVRRHKRVMLALYLGALVLAGAFTLMPGRLLHRVFFG